MPYFRDVSSDEYQESSSGDDDVPVPNQRTRQPKEAREGPEKPRQIREIPQIAKVDELASDEVNSSATDNRLAKVDQSELAKIRKAFNLAQHEATGEAEAKAALRTASKLMARINITQADLISQESTEEKRRRAGMSTVLILPNTHSRRPAKAIRAQEWQGLCASACKIFFDVKYYTTAWRGHSQFKYTFYGILENTTAAALAFEMIINTVLTWCSVKDDLKGLVAFNSYRIGVGRGLVKTAEKEKKEEEKAAIEREQKLLKERTAQEVDDRKKRLERLESSDSFLNKRDGDPTRETDEPLREHYDEDPGFDDSDSDANTVSRYHTPEADFIEEDDVLGLLDLEEDKPRLPSHPEREGSLVKKEDGVKKEEEILLGFGQGEDDIKPKIEESADPVVKKEEPNADVSVWESATQLVLFRRNAEGIADDFAKEKIGKLSKSRARQATKRDWQAYHKGQRDSGKIDVKRRRIQGGDIRGDQSELF